MWDSTASLYLVLIFICLVVSAFFSSSETAFISLQRIRLKHLESTGVAGVGRVSRLLGKPERFLATILLGNNFINTAAAALGTAIAVSVWANSNTAILVATLGMTVLLLVFGEVIPKTVATRHSERLSLVYVRPLELISWLLWPFTAALSWAGAGVARLVGGEPAPKALISEEEIRTMIAVGREEGSVEEAEADMLHKVFHFGDRPLYQTMTPRPDIVWVERGVTLQQFLERYAEAPHSRYPVYQENTDNVVGMLAIKDVLMAQAREGVGAASSLDHLIRPIAFVPEVKLVGELFAELQAAGSQMAMVVDEYGSISGLVTLEELLEELVGEIGDELVAPEKDFETIDERTFQVDGGMRVEEANEQLALGLPEGDYETVSGFVLSRLGHIPKVGEQLKYESLKLTVTEMRGMRIERIMVSREAPPDAAPQG